MKFERINDVLILWIAEDITITFRDEWVQHLSTLPYDKFGEFIRVNIYSSLSDTDKKIWNRATISNLDLRTAAQTFLAYIKQNEPKKY